MKINKQQLEELKSHSEEWRKDFLKTQPLEQAVSAQLVWEALYLIDDLLLALDGKVDITKGL